MKWNVAGFLLTAAVTSATPVQAATVFIQEIEDHYDDVAVKSFTFGTNQTPSRAWVKLDVYRRDPTNTPELDPYSTVSAWVPGLSLVGDRIVFTSGGRTTLCATVHHKRFLFFRYDTVEKTGRCTVSAVPGARRADNGFVARTVPVLKVYFQVQE